MLIITTFSFSPQCLPSGHYSMEHCLLVMINSKLTFLCPHIDRSRAYSFWPARLSVGLSLETFTLSKALEW